jgi:hypothetical protein
MGSQKDVMTTFAERDIRQQFSEFDGWNVAPINGVQSSVALFRASRNRSYHEEVSFIAVSFDQIPENECITALDALPSSRGSRVKKFLLTPQATDISLTPPHVQVLLMKAFAFADGDLVWLTKKKNARQYPCMPAAPAPEPVTTPATPTS